MRLKLTAAEGGFMSGSQAHLFLDGVDVSKYVARVVLTVTAEEAISAEVTVFCTGVDVDVPVVLRPIINHGSDHDPIGELPAQHNSKELIAS